MNLSVPDNMKITHQKPLLWSFLFRKSQFAFSISRNAGGKVKLVNEHMSMINDLLQLKQFKS